MALQDDRYTRHIATPTGLDFAKAAELYGLGHARVADLHEFREALEGALAAGVGGVRSSIVEVPSSREANVARARELLAVPPPAPAVGEAPRVVPALADRGQLKGIGRDVVIGNISARIEPLVAKE